MLELYGGGGGTSRRLGASGYSGGASCQHYDSISLTAGESIEIVVGRGGLGGNTGGETSFGSYSVSGGGAGSSNVAGAKAGNYGAAGERLTGSESSITYGTGVFSEKYGFGASEHTTKGGDGAVYLKYLGA